MNGQSKNNKEVIAKSSAPSFCIYSDVKMEVKGKSTEKCFAEDFSFNDNLLPILDYSQEKQNQCDNATSLPSYVSDQKSLKTKFFLE